MYSEARVGLFGIVVALWALPAIAQDVEPQDAPHLPDPDCASFSAGSPAMPCHAEADPGSRAAQAVAASDEATEIETDIGLGIRAGAFLFRLLGNTRQDGPDGG